MASTASVPCVDLATIAGLGLLLLPLTTMWHEIGGHALACAVQGGHVAAIGAFYVDCVGLARWPNTIVAVAGVTMDILLSCAAYLLWRRVIGDTLRLMLWLIWVGKAFVAAGYLGFSGVSGFGDLAPGLNDGGGLGPVPFSGAFRVGEVVVGVLIYVALVRAAIRTLATMIGSGTQARLATRKIAHGYYITAGLTAVFVGLFNPIGILITALSAAASSFGGLAGFISVGFAGSAAAAPRQFAFVRQPGLIVAGLITAVIFAAVLGPTLRF